MAKTKRLSLPRLKPNGWIMIVQSILQVGANSSDSTEFTGSVEYPIIVGLYNCVEFPLFVYHVLYIYKCGTEKGFSNIYIILV